MATLTPSCRFLPAIGLGLLLTACGGGGGSDSSSAPPSGGGGGGGGTPTATVSGTAAVGAAITGATITATCQDGSGFTVSPVTTDTNGKWSGKVESDQLPCLLELKNGTPNIELNSMVFAAGTANISPLTHLALVMTKADADFNWTDNTANWPAKTLLETSAATLLQTLKDKGYADASLSGNPFTTAFDANGTGWDALLDNIRELVEDPAGSINGYDALAQLLADGNIDSLPDAPADPTDPGEPSDMEYALAPADFSALSDQPEPQDFFDLMKSQSWPVVIVEAPDTHPEWYGVGSLTIGGSPALTPGSYPGTVEISGTWTMELKGADGTTITSLSSDDAASDSIVDRYIKPFSGSAMNGEIHINKDGSTAGMLKIYASANGQIWGQTGLTGAQAVEFRNDIVAYSDESDSVPAIFDELAGTWSAEVTDSCVEPAQPATNTVTITTEGDVILNGPVAGTISGQCAEMVFPKTLHWGGSNDVLIPHNPATGGGPASSAYLMRIDTVNTGVDGGEVNIYLDGNRNIVEINTRSPKLTMTAPVKAETTDPAVAQSAVDSADFGTNASPTDEEFLTVMASQSWPVAIYQTPEDHPEWYGQGSLTIGGTTGNWTMELKGADGSVIASLNADGAITSEFTPFYEANYGLGPIPMPGQIFINKGTAINEYLDVFVEQNTGLLEGSAGGTGEVRFRNSVVAYGAGIPAIFADLAGTWTGTWENWCVNPPKVDSNTLTITEAGVVTLENTGSQGCSDVFPQSFSWGGYDDFLIPDPEETDGSYFMLIDAQDFTNVSNGKLTIHFDADMNVTKFTAWTPSAYEMEDPVKQ